MEPLEPRTLLAAVVNTPFTLPIANQAVVQAGDLAFFYSSESHRAATGGLFDPFSGSFYPVTMPAEMAAGNLVRDNNSVATLGNKTYFAGGDTQTGNPRFSDLVEIFDQSTGVWSTAHLSVGRDGPAAVAVGNKVVFAGGFANSSSQENVVDIYDATTGVWNTAQLSAPGTVIAKVVGHKAYFLGASSLDIYDADMNTWSSSATPFTTSGSALNFQVVVTKLVVVDFSFATGRSRAEVYDTVRNRWSAFANLGSDDFSGSPTGVIGNQAVYLGGFFHNGAGGGSPAKITRFFNAKTGKFSSLAKSHVGNLTTSNGVQIGNTLVFEDDNGVTSYNPSKGSWTAANAGTPIHLLSTGGNALDVLQSADDQLWIYHGSEVGLRNAQPSPPLDHPLVEDINFTSPGDDLSPSVTVLPTANANAAFGWSSTPNAISYDLLIDGNVAGNATDNVWSATTLGLASGKHSLQIRANLASGNSLLGPSIDFTISG